MRWQAALAVCVLVCPSAQAEPLTLEATIPLSNVSGRIDHLTVDLARKQLFVAELGNNSVEAIDLATRKVVHRIAGLDEPQGVLYLAGPDLLVVANGGDGSVRLFGGGDFASRGSIKLAGDADNLRLEPGSGQVIAGYGDGGLAVIDVAKKQVTANIGLPGHPESFRQSGGQVFVNVPDASAIAVVDLAARKITAQWNASHSGNFPMIVDADHGQIAVVYRGPPRFALLDMTSGKQVQELLTCGDSDDVFYDAKRQRFYVSCGTGGVDVFARDGNAIKTIGHAPAPPGSRTSLFVPELDRLFVAVRAGLLGSTASLLVFKPNGN